MKTALIDADTLIYEASLGAERPIEWSNDLWTLHANMDDARLSFDKLVDEIKEATGADRLILALSDSNSAARWRNAVMSTYKMNRKRVRRPVVYAPLREYCHSHYETFERPGLEGDDVLGILVTHPAIVRGQKVCVSIDKDLKTIPGEHYNYGRKESFTITEVGANYYHLMQTLIGDTTDGYPGCPGVGPKGAEKILIPFVVEEPKYEYEEFDVPNAWGAVLKAYKKAGLSEEVALMNARVARICRHTDYNFDKKEVILWNP